MDLGPKGPPAIGRLRKPMEVCLYWQIIVRELRELAWGLGRPWRDD
jgi:hypothetical protein